MSTFRIYNETLCPDLWDEFQHLDPRTRVNLLRMAYDFYKKTRFVAPIVDIWLMGSIANFNWTPDSDVDVHIIIDFSQMKMPPETASKVAKSAGAQWNNEHEVTIKGHKVEINMQSAKAKKPYVTGIYSLVKDEWIRQPQHQNVAVDKVSIQSKYSGMKKYIESAIRSGNRETMKQAKDYLDAFRQYGLDCGGELSIENIVYKILRSKGVIKMLKDSITATYDKEMTVAEGDVQPEVYDYIGGIVDGEVRGERVPLGKVKSHLHIEYPGLYSGANHTNWRYDAKKNQVTWNLEPDPEDKPMVDDFLFKRGIKSPTHKTMYWEKLNEGDKSSQPEVKSKNFRIQFGDPQVAKGAGIIYLGDMWFANTYRDHDKKMWLINRHTGAMKMKLPPVNEWFYTPEGVLDYLEKWYNSSQKVSEIAFPNQVRSDRDIGLKGTMLDVMARMLQKVGGREKFNMTFSIWLNERGLDWDKLDEEGQSHLLEIFCRGYLMGKDLVDETSEKDIKSHHPPPENVRYNDDRTLRLDRMTLDNLKSLRAKCVRSWEFHKQTNNVEGMKVAKEDFKYFDDELKKRMKYINVPVMETKAKPLPWYIDPSTVPLEQVKSIPYWISPNGNFFDAGDSHMAFAQMYLYPDAKDAKKEAINNGWIRVRSHPTGGGIEVEFNKMTGNQKKALEKFAKSQEIDRFVGPDYEDITLKEGIENNPFQDLLRSMPPEFGRNVKINGNKLFIKNGEVPLMYVNFEPIDKAYSVLKFRKDGHGLVQDPNVKTFYDVKGLVTYLKKPALGEGFGWGQHPEKDPLHLPGERWRIKWYNARKTPKMKKENVDETEKVVN